jgi:ATP-dependent DNA ligase
MTASASWPDEKLITRHGNDFSSRFPVIVAAVTALAAQSFLIDGEPIVTNGDGLAVFDLIRHKRPTATLRCLLLSI